MTEFQYRLGEGWIPFQDEEKSNVVDTPQKSKVFSRDWTKYNLSQVNMKPMSLKILRGVIASLNIKTIGRNTGRPPKQLDDMIYCCVIKAMENKSLRINDGELELPKLKHYIQDVPHFNTINNYMNDSSITRYLYLINDRLVELVAPFEDVLSADSTGISSENQDRWIKVRLDFVKHKVYKKLHVIAGVKTHIIFACKVTDGTAGDSPHFKELLARIPKNLKPKDVCADPAYFSAENIEAVEAIGAKPYIKPRSNVLVKNKGSPARGRMMRMWAYQKKEFMKHYNFRPLVEAVFSSLKRKFSAYIKSKNPVAQENEIVCKIIAYNISILIYLIFTLKIDTPFLD